MHNNILVIIIVLLIALVYAVYAHDAGVEGLEPLPLRPTARPRSRTFGPPAQSPEYKSPYSYYGVRGSYADLTDTTMYEIILSANMPKDQMDAVAKKYSIDKTAGRAVSMEQIADRLNAVAFDDQGTFYARVPNSMPTCVGEIVKESRFISIFDSQRKYFEQQPLRDSDIIFHNTYFRDLSKQSPIMFHAEPGRIEGKYAPMNRGAPVPVQHRNAATMNAIATATPNCVAFDTAGNLYNTISPYNERAPLDSTSTVVMFVRDGVEPKRSFAPIFGVDMRSLSGETMAPAAEVMWKAASDATKLGVTVYRDSASYANIDAAQLTMDSVAGTDDSIAYVPVEQRTARPIFKGRSSRMYRTVGTGIIADNVWGHTVKNSNPGAAMDEPKDGVWQNSQNVAMYCRNTKTPANSVLSLGQDPMWTDMSTGKTPGWRNGACELQIRQGSAFDKRVQSVAPATQAKR